jgi:hypothetical protein
MVWPQIVLVNRVLEGVLAELPSLGICRQEMHRRDVVARRIMSAVAGGERNFEALKRAALDK